MTSDIQRYDVWPFDCEHGINCPTVDLRVSHDGDYVLYEDYATLRSQLADAEQRARYEADAGKRLPAPRS